MNSSNLKKTGTVYFPNLDAARFLAAFAVFLLHFSNEIRGTFPYLNAEPIFTFFYTFTGKGGLGVNFFFVLSGFLITYLILAERKNNGFFHVGKFLIRRTLRIWPLYFLIGLVGFVLFPILFSTYSTAHQPLNYFLFLANFDELWSGTLDSVNFLTAPWSVAVEEQFYLFWGLALFILFRIKKFQPLYLILILYLISFYFRWDNWQNERILHYHTLAVCQDILMGSFIGLSLFQQKKWLDVLQKIPKWGVLLAYLIGIGICVTKNKLFVGQAVVAERFLLSLFFAFVILDQIRGEHSLFKLGKMKFMTYLGKISYGLYMYHLVVMYLLLRFLPLQDFSAPVSSFIFFITSFGFTVLISAISYRYFESKFLSLKPQ